MRLPGPLYRLRRRLFGRYELDDPRPHAREGPYTFELPTAEEIAAVMPGDLVKLIFRSIPASAEWDAERMWVIVEAAEGDRLSGSLDNHPSDMPQLRPGARIEFRRHQIISIRWDEDRVVEPPPPPPPRRDYLERRMVDRCVTVDRIPVHYLYREAPDLGQEDDRYPDSGWRIRGDYRGLSDEEMEARESEYVALARVLNADDGWVHLIDSPPGSAFIRDWDTGQFVPLEREDG
ncbi:MAG TPA: DUF2185 domain-containing protein [Allosphingosinicella sp.]|jgi:hypothetical protein|nr:DUF2185 domain-containing protein [Allosphingosinicella sp.]